MTKSSEREVTSSGCELIPAAEEPFRMVGCADYPGWDFIVGVSG